MTTAKVLKLYRSSLKAARDFVDYNFREYALRSVRNRYRSNRSVTNPQQIEDLIREGEKNLQILRRQVLIGKLYASNSVFLSRNSEKSDSEKVT